MLHPNDLEPEPEDPIYAQARAKVWGNYLETRDEMRAKAAPKISESRIPEPVTRRSVLESAMAATAERGLNYGKPEANFERIATRWRAHIMNRYGLDVALDGASVAIMCADIKLARLENQIEHLDSWIDLAGYAACGAEIAAKNK